MLALRPGRRALASLSTDEANRAMRSLAGSSGDFRRYTVTLCPVTRLEGRVLT